MRKGEGDEPRLVAYLQAVVGTEPVTREVHAFLKARLPDYMVPSGYLVLAQLPLTSHGKVDRQALLRHPSRLAMALSNSQRLAIRSRRRWREFGQSYWALSGLEYLTISSS